MSRGECGREHDPRPYREYEVATWRGGWTGALKFEPREDYCQIEDCYSRELEDSNE